jgi:hypothetical protein
VLEHDLFKCRNLDFTSRRWVEGLAGQAYGYAEGDRSGDVRFASAAFGGSCAASGWPPLPGALEIEVCFAVVGQ